MSIRKAIFDTPRKEGEERPNGPYLVIYPDDYADLSWYADGYFRAASFLIDTLIQRGTSARNDPYIFPILFNLIHALELHLKIYLSVLRNHYNKKSCDCLPPPDSAVKKILGRHELKPIFEAILLMVYHKNLHGNKEFRNLSLILDEIEEMGLNPETLRYDKIKTGVKNKVLEKQRWVYLEELKLSFKNAIEFLRVSYNSIDFFFCESHELKKETVNEIDHMIEILKEIKNKSGFKPIAIKPESGLIGQFDSDDLSEFYENDMKNRELVKKFTRSFNDHKLVLATRGIRFGKNSPSGVPDKEWFEKSWDRAQQMEHLSEDFQLVDKAIEGLLQHKVYIESKIKINK